MRKQKHVQKYSGLKTVRGKPENRETAVAARVLGERKAPGLSLASSCGGRGGMHRQENQGTCARRTSQTVKGVQSGGAGREEDWSMSRFNSKGFAEFCRGGADANGGRPVRRRVAYSTNAHFFLTLCTNRVEWNFISTHIGVGARRMFGGQEVKRGQGSKCWRGKWEV